MFEQVFEHGFMTGTTADQARRVTALDQARLLLAQAKARKPQPPEDPTPSADPLADPAPTRLTTVSSFDPDSLHHPDHLTPSTARLASVTGPAPARRSAPASLDHGSSDDSPSCLTSVAGSDPIATSSVGRLPSVSRVQQALDTAGVDRALPTLPAVSELLSGAALVMALMAGPSAEGAWCGVVGLPSFGAEAARGLGVDLERLVLVPDPGQDWLNVVAALVDALTVVVVRPPGEVTPGEASRLAARLRTRGAILIAYGSWPGSEARLEVESNTWTGLGDGEGLLTARQATVVVTGRRVAVHPRRHQLWLPAQDGTIRSVESSRTETPRWREEAVG
jgi:hypothetical protein